MLGLAMSQHLLGDEINAKNTMSQIRNVELSRSEKIKYGAMDVLNSIGPELPI